MTTIGTRLIPYFPLIFGAIGGLLVFALQGDEQALGLWLGGTVVGAQLADELQPCTQMHTLERNLIPQSVVEALKTGNERALQTIYLHMKAPLVRFLFALLKSKEEAEDIAQETFITLWENRATLDTRRNVRSLIFTIARHKVINLFIRNQKGQQYASDVERDGSELDANSEEALIARETELLVDLVVNRMPEMRRDVFVMSYHQGLTNDEISERLNMAKPNVANHLARAKREIKKILLQ
ncbi:MAG: sigma-70 family RNA polymerase sigma factor [Prevotellaceae bacterium]|nr:sigma-70 family RNA polymerase sigma factor [Prevotellaceae bacterium]